MRYSIDFILPSSQQKHEQTKINIQILPLVPELFLFLVFSSGNSAYSFTAMTYHILKKYCIAIIRRDTITTIIMQKLDPTSEVLTQNLSPSPQLLQYFIPMLSTLKRYSSGYCSITIVLSLRVLFLRRETPSLSKSKMRTLWESDSTPDISSRYSWNNEVMWWCFVSESDEED